MVKSTMDPHQGNQRLDWYQDARFGMFIHWGAYSVAGVEASWSMMEPDLAKVLFGARKPISEAEYTALPAKFNPTQFDPDAWVKAAKQAGMRYMVITAKHHDGFCMFDAPGTDYKITNTPYGKDVCLLLSQACTRAGMPLGFYYSPPDMHHPGYRDTGKPVRKNWLGEPKRKQWAEYLEYMERHIRKLLTDYGKVSILWFDGLANTGKYDPQRFFNIIHELSPDTLINDRMGDDFDFITPEQFIPKGGVPVMTGKPAAVSDPGGEGFFKTVASLYRIPIISGWMRKQMEKYRDGKLVLTPVVKTPYPAQQDFQPWETCMTMGQTWSYDPNETKWKAPGTLVRNLAEVASRGGNYLLNVGPTEKGTLPEPALERLRYVGKWMEKNCESIYGTTYTPLQDLAWGRATRKENKIYLHVFDWPAEGMLTVPGFPAKANSVKLLPGDGLKFKQTDDQLEIYHLGKTPDPDDSVIVVDFEDPQKGLDAYSPKIETRVKPGIYVRKQATNSAIFNSVLNGLLALSSLPMQLRKTYAEAAVDVLITVAIIAFLTSWLMIGVARGEVAKGNILGLKTKWSWLKLPKNAALRALLITLACVIVFGGLVLDGGLYLAAPNGIVNWAYIIFKTIYTGVSGALACSLSILSVLNDQKRS